MTVRDSGTPPPGLGPAIGAVLALGTELARLLDHLTRRRGGLTFSQFQLLALLRAAHPEPMEPWEIGRGLASGSAQVSALLDGLERAGLVERRAHDQDRRRRYVHLTDEGLRRAERVGVLVRALEERIVAAGLTPDEARAFGDAAARLRGAVGELTAADLSFQLLADPGHRPDAGAL